GRVFLQVALDVELDDAPAGPGALPGQLVQVQAVLLGQAAGDRAGQQRLVLRRGLRALTPAIRGGRRRFPRRCWGALTPAAARFHGRGGRALTFTVRRGAGGSILHSVCLRLTLTPRAARSPAGERG